MGTTADKLNKIIDSKAKIKAAIESKGVENVGDVLANYPDKITSIQSGCKPGYLEINEVNIKQTQFRGTSYIKEVKLPKDMSMITSMRSAFEGFDLNSIIIPDLPLVTDMHSCLSGCQRLSTAVIPDLPNVTDLGYCFNSCYGLKDLTIGKIGNNIKTLSDWQLNHRRMTKQSVLNVLNALPDPAVGDKKCAIGEWQLGLLTPEEIAIGTNKGWTLI